jgi:hypothetical protein
MTCRDMGASATGSSYNSFRCGLAYAVTEVCVRVAKRAGVWSIQSGTLPERPQGTNGPGVVSTLDISSWAFGLSIAYPLCPSPAHDMIMRYRT